MTVKQQTFDCRACSKRLECMYRDHPNYCPQEQLQGRGTRKFRGLPIQYWGQTMK